ncbi:MAG: NifU family protein [Bacilli bacterium]|nr:NifU family protein [Bacilli bacterium]
MDIENKINEVLAKIKPFLNSDGGDVEFLKYEDGIVFVKLLGACGHCAYANETLKSTIENALVAEIPEVLKVVNME